MNALFKKLNYKDQPVIACLNAPATFEVHLKEMAQYADIVTTLDKSNTITFAIVFVMLQKELNDIAPQLAPKLKDDAVVWFCYPKKSAKNYKSDINRDKGWDILGNYQMEGVRQVAIDDDWSALRFRKVAYIKSLKRSFKTLSEEGKNKAGHK